MKHVTTWHSPHPLWPTELSNQATIEHFKRPAILRFASDSFMEDLIRAAQEAPESLGDLQLKNETWRMTEDELAAQEAPTGPVKLYQPAHGRFYVAAASLVCQMRGLPDREIDIPGGDVVGVVMRRARRDHESGSLPEFAWCGKEKGWVAVDANRLAVGEQLLPTFKVNFPTTEFSGGKETERRRTLHAGLIPASSVETYLATGLSSVPDPEDVPEATNPDGSQAKDPVSDPRLSRFESIVEDGLLILENGINNSSSSELSDEMAREIFSFSAMDLIGFFNQNLPSVSGAILAADEGDPGVSANPVVQAVLNELNPDWVSILKEANAYQASIELGELDAIPDGSAPHLKTSTRDEIREHINHLGSDLGSAVSAALNDESLEDETPPISYTPEGESSADPNVSKKLLPEDDQGRITYYVRFVYDQPKCRKHFEELTKSDSGDVALLRERLAAHEHYRPRISEPSQPFHLTSFFDTDAPQRPIRITMPTDTSISGLRKSPRNVSIAMSNQLREQMQKVGKSFEELKDVGKGDSMSFDIGVICSFSIHIIFIIAFSVMIIFLFVLNIVFWWLPFFRICFPFLLPKKS